MKARKILVSTVAVIAGCTFALGFSGCEYSSKIVDYKDKRYVKNGVFEFEWTGNDAYGLIGCASSQTELCVPETINGYAVSAIEDGAFRNQTHIYHVALPNTIERIGEYAFYRCECMQYILLPLEVEEIGKYAFAECDNLTILCEAESQPEGWDADWNADNCPVVWGYTETV